MPKHPVTDPITDQEMAFALLIREQSGDEQSGDMIPIHHQKSQRLFAALGMLPSNHCPHFWQADA